MNEERDFILPLSRASEGAALDLRGWIISKIGVNTTTSRHACKTSVTDCRFALFPQEQLDLCESYWCLRLAET